MLRSGAISISAALVFGVLMFIAAKVSCAISPPNECYISEDAWLILPLMLMVPALITQALSHPIIIVAEKLTKKQDVGYLVVYPVVLLFLLHFWLAVTGQDSATRFTGKVEIPLALDGLIMGAYVYVLKRKFPSNRVAGGL